MNEKGQLILTLILVMTVALAIGLSIVQKSLVDVSTSTKVEQSSRAFSAAEAGIEKALKGDSSGVSFPETNSRTTSVVDTFLTPCVPGTAGCNPEGSLQDPLETPDVEKEDAIQFWLADPDPNVNLPGCSAKDPTGHIPICYTDNSLSVYWGDIASDLPAITLTFVYFSSGQYQSLKYYFDPDANRAAQTNFTPVTCSGNEQLPKNTYQCHELISGLPTLPNARLMIVRARLLYNTQSQPVAIRATCIGSGVGSGCNLPPQAREITSTGVSGETQRKVRLFQELYVVPPYFDYAIFSQGKIEK